MPIVTIVPATKEIEDLIDKNMGQVRQRIKLQIVDTFGVPAYDVLVSLARCPYRNVDPASADYVLYADTCPDEKQEIKADLLCKQIASVLSELGLTGGGAEVWQRFLPGSWCLVRGGEIVDSVSHNRE